MAGDIEYKTPEDVAEERARKRASKAYDETMPEPDTTFSKLGRKAAGAVMAVPAGISGATLLGLLPGSPGVIDSAKYGAKTMYHTINGDKKANDEAEKEYMDAAKRAQSIERQRNTGENTNAMGDTYKRGGKVKKMASGGKVSSASARADGIAVKGHTKGKYL